jgi:hypothetical protein
MPQPEGSQYQVVIEVRGGIAECVHQPDGVEVIVHDYDLEAYYPCSEEEEREHVHKDEDGEEYWEKII